MSSKYLVMRDIVLEQIGLDLLLMNNCFIWARLSQLSNIHHACSSNPNRSYITSGEYDYHRFRSIVDRQHSSIPWSSKTQDRYVY
jgi:hypothetical protein